MKTLYPETILRVACVRAPRVLENLDGKHQRAVDMVCAGLRVGDTMTFAEAQRREYMIWQLAQISENNCRKFTTPKEFYTRRIETGVYEIVG